MTYLHPSTQRLLARFQIDLPQGIVLYGEIGSGLRTLAWEITRAYTNETILVEPDAKGTIGIDRIRELYALGRNKSTKTVFIIDDADAMGIEAQNALLKLLEEPVPGVRFILTTHAIDRLLPTIRSRVEAHAVRPLTPQQTNALLDELRVTDPTKRSQLLFIAIGLPAALTRYATTPKLFTERSQTIRDARTFLGGSREDRLLLVSTYKERDHALALVRDMGRLLQRTITAGSTLAATDSLDTVLHTEAALIENASVRLSLTHLALVV